MRTHKAFLVFIIIAPALLGQEQVDKPDAAARVRTTGSKLALRVRVTRVSPAQEKIQINWRRGGEGLGGEVVRGQFTSEEHQPDIAVGAWTAWVPLTEIAGRSRSWDFPTLVISSSASDAKGRGDKRQSFAIQSAEVDFEFAESGKVLKRFTEPSPKGATVGFALPPGLLDAREPSPPELVSQLQGLSGHARARRERLEALFPGPPPALKQFGVIGHLGGYGEGSIFGKGGGSGYGVRHCNPGILADECRTLRLLGVNGVVGSLRPLEIAGFSNEFRRIYWGGPGSGNPMSFFQRGGKTLANGCPFDPALKPHVMRTVQAAIEEHRAAGAKESWALWDDEIGVYAKEHIVSCERCAQEFRNYLRTEKVSLAELRQASWDDVKPYNIWATPDESRAAGQTRGSRGSGMAPAPGHAGAALRYYYTFRFMTHATAQVYPEAARKFKDAGILLYAMQGPTPSWSGHSLDWHEFYDHGANTAFVWETSNREPRVWQWESYLADLARGIAARHEMPMGALIKPHRGAPEQRMLSLVARGVKVIEWYTYGPDYAKGDSFSQSPDLLERVARAARFLGRAEEFLYGARLAGQPEVAVVSPRSSEIWGKATELGVTAFEDAKWVYLALAHAHIPMDVLSEQQLAEGNLGRYKVIYVVGPNLRRDAGVKLLEWVRAGGTLWTDALGLSRDEANRPAAALHEMFGVGERALESWGSVEGYRAVDLKPLIESEPRANAMFVWDGAPIRAAIGREPLEIKTGDVLARFSDGKTAVVRQRCGKGEVFVAGFWAGLTYSAKVRRSDFDMRADFDPAVRDLIARPAMARGAYRPAVPADALVEADLLEKGRQRGVALMNWSYQREPGGAARGRLQIVKNLRVALPGVANVKSARSLLRGELKVENNSVVLPELEEIDLLILE